MQNYLFDKNKIGIIIFPGTNSEYDTFYAVKKAINVECDFIWHADKISLKKYSSLFIPGGYSYGDKPLAGQAAAQSPIVNQLQEFIKEGKRIIGICNGFQILIQMGIFPGILKKNPDGFVSDFVFSKVESNSLFFKNLKKNDIFKFAIANRFGSYFCDNIIYEELIKNKQILLTYCSQDGDVTPFNDYTKSTNNIAAILNKQGNVLGMMSHPERSIDKEYGTEDGLSFLEQILS